MSWVKMFPDTFSQNEREILIEKEWLEAELQELRRDISTLQTHRKKLSLLVGRAAEFEKKMVKLAPSGPKTSIIEVRLHLKNTSN